MTERPIKLSLDISNLEAQVQSIVNAQNKTSKAVEQIYELVEALSNTDKKLNDVIKKTTKEELDKYMRTAEQFGLKIEKVKRKYKTEEKKLHILHDKVSQCKSILQLDKVLR